MAEQRDEEQLPPVGEEAHRVLARARAAAHRLRHATLGTEHLLIGCVEESHGEAAELLYRAGITLPVVLSHVKLLGNPTVAAAPEELQMAPGLRTALRLARDEAERLRDGQVRSEHLLIALLRERAGGGAVVLRAAGLDVGVMRTAISRAHLGGAASKLRVPWIARGPYGVLAIVACAAALSAIAFTIHWFVAIRPALRSAYLFDLLIPVALLSIGLVGIGASRIEAARQVVARESLIASWRSRGAVPQIAAALGIAVAGAVEPATQLLAAAVDREMPETEVRAALPVLARWLAVEELAPYGHFARGLLRVRNGQTQAGLADLDKAIHMRPENMNWRIVYGASLASSGRDDDALPLLRAAALDQGADHLAKLELANLLIRRGEPVEAEALAAEVAQAFPGVARPLCTLAVARYLQSENVAAHEALAAASMADEQDLTARTIQAALLLRNGRAPEALSLVRDAAASTIERPGYLAALEGRALAALGREQEAKLAFAEARERDPHLAAMLRRMRQGLIENHLDTTAAEVDAVLAELEP